MVAPSSEKNTETDPSSHFCSLSHHKCHTCIVGERIGLEELFSLCRLTPVCAHLHSDCFCFLAILQAGVVQCMLAVVTCPQAWENVNLTLLRSRKMRR